jgi:hypothetical protein
LAIIAHISVAVIIGKAMGILKDRQPAFGYSCARTAARTNAGAAG